MPLILASMCLPALAAFLSTLDTTTNPRINLTLDLTFSLNKPKFMAAFTLNYCLMSLLKYPCYLKKLSPFTSTCLFVYNAAWLPVNIVPIFLYSIFIEFNFYWYWLHVANFFRPMHFAGGRTILGLKIAQSIPNFKLEYPFVSLLPLYTIFVDCGI